MREALGRLAGRLPKVPKRGLLLLAGLVWLAAGVNILRLGAPDMVSFWTGALPAALTLIGAMAVFLLFFLLIFRRLIAKHTARIRAYEAGHVMVLCFFDKKSYLLMAFMMSFGIALRKSGLVPPLYLGTFYAGLGASLMGAGLGFLLAFCRWSGADTGLPGEDET